MNACTHQRFSFILEVGYRWLFLGNFFESKRTPIFFKDFDVRRQEKKRKTIFEKNSMFAGPLKLKIADF